MDGKRKFTPETIDELKANEVFVFGSNRNGNHYGGAAKVAYEKFGAEWGVGEGHTGQSYALPTLDENMEKVTEDELEDSFAKLIGYADDNRQLTFYVTKVGCGIAGWDVETVRRCFWKGAAEVSPDPEWRSIPSNVIIPEEFLYGGIDKHCSFCEYYRTINGFMYCCLLKRKITARKEYCNEFKPNDKIYKNTNE